MKKILLLFACSVIISATAQNNVNLVPQKNNDKKGPTVREMAFKQSPVYKRQQERIKISKNTPSYGSSKSGNRSGCLIYTFSDPYTYFSANSDPLDSIVNWTWNYGDGYIDSTTYDQTGHYYQLNGIQSYIVCLTTTDINGLSVSCCDTITIGSMSSCYSDFYATVDSANLVTFADGSYSNDSITSWAWDFGDNTGSLLQNPSHQYLNNGIYNVCLTITTTSGCTNTYCYSVNVNDYTTSCYSYFNFTEGFGSFYFTDVSSTSFGNVDSWSWDFGDNTNSTMQSPTHVYALPGNYYVCLTITTDSGCTSTFCDYVNNQINSDLIVDTIANLEQTLSTLLFGSCVTVSNLSYTGAPSAIGYFSDNSAGIDSAFTYGLLLTTGNVYNAVGPNNSTSAGTSNNLPGDSDLDLLIPGYTTYDASVIEFDFVSVSDTVIASKIVFASEEYPEYVGTSFNDVFGFYISGPGISGVQNLALVPTTSDPISINSVNQNLNTGYYVDNANGTTYQYDGRTTIIELRQAVVPGQSYHFKIAIADAGDGVFDSGVLIKAGSFNGNTLVPQANFTAVETTNLTVDFTNTSINANVYAWDFGDGATDMTANPSHTYAQAGTYTVVLFASNVCYSDTTSMVITVGANGINGYNAGNSIKIIPTSVSGIYNAVIQSSVNEKVEVKIYNLSGQLIINKSFSSNVGQNSFTIDLSEFSTGIYSVQIIGNKEHFKSKMIR